jgi:plasmid maintenance system killer protein
VSIAGRHHESDFIFDRVYSADTSLDEKIQSSLNSIFENKQEILRNLKDVKTLITCYEKRKYKQQADEEGILSVIVNKIIEELLKQIEPYYVDSRKEH